MNDTFAHVEDMKARWMVGGSAEAACPVGWRDALGEQPDLDLLALAGQFGRIATVPALAGKITERPPLPKIALRQIPKDLRALFRTVLGTRGIDAAAVVTLVAARGYAVRPMDWMPAATAMDVPEIYRPWVDWLAVPSARAADGEVPSAETWDDWPPQARLAAVEALRQRDPEAARDLIAAIAPTLAADARHRLISILAIGLQDADAEFLVSLENDRSGKVQGLARLLLGRLGKIHADADAAAEFADFFEVRRAGLLSRQQVVVAKKLKTSAQRNRRMELAAILPLKTLADGLGVTASQLVDMWSGGDGTGEIVAMTAATGTETENERLLDRFVDKAEAEADLLPLLERISPQARLRLAPRLAAIDWRDFDMTIRCLGGKLGVLDYGPLQKSAPMVRLLSALKKDGEDHTSRQIIETVLANLGLIASRAAAERLVEEFQRFGLMAADPRLSLLRLNAALKETS